MKNKESSNKNTSIDLVTVLFLIFLYPIGLILMWHKNIWSKWVKILITVPLFLGIIWLILGIILLAAVDPNVQIKKGVCVQQCENSINRDSCYNDCLSK